LANNGRIAAPKDLDQLNTQRIELEKINEELGSAGFHNPEIHALLKGVCSFL